MKRDWAEQRCYVKALSRFLFYLKLEFSQATLVRQTTVMIQLTEDLLYSCFSRTVSAVFDEHDLS